MKFSIAVKDERIYLIPGKKTKEENLKSNLVNYRLSESKDFYFYVTERRSLISKNWERKKWKKTKNKKSEKKKLKKKKCMYKERVK